MTSGRGKITDYKQLAQDAINFAIDFLEVASANHIAQRSLPAASSTMNRPVLAAPQRVRCAQAKSIGGVVRFSPMMQLHYKCKSRCCLVAHR